MMRLAGLMAALATISDDMTVMAFSLISFGLITENGVFGEFFAGRRSVNLA